MTDYLNHSFNPKDYSSVSALDEAPFWSLPFAVALMNKIDYKPIDNILDLGCGTGFVSIELAQRFGEQTAVHSLDPWDNAIKRMLEKINIQKIPNIKTYIAKAEEMPFDDNFFDLIISNNGLNNVENQKKAVKECYRTLKKGGKLISTHNLPGSFKPLYKVFIKLLKEKGLKQEIKSVKEHIKSKRKTIKEASKLYEKVGFKIKETYQYQFSYKYCNSRAFFNHYLIKSFFLDSWISIIKHELRKPFFDDLEEELDKYFKKRMLTMKIPFCCIIAKK